MSSECPNDNSNEAIACLLRLISSNTTPNWNWDPLNFAVTAAIGILALIIAGITVFQGLLAAGPGRLKASNLAIGPFSIHSRSRFDRTEVALRTTARVPLITWDVVYHRIVRQKFRPNFDDPSHAHLHHRRNNSNSTRTLGAVDDADYNGTTRGGLTTLKQRHQYDSTATWLTLLTALGLDDPTFFPLVQRVTDYLPTDIQAAPAATELRCLAILAVIADANATIEAAGPGNRFYRVITDSSQLVFRDHPALGTVAAYEAYEETAVLQVGDAPALQFGNPFPVLKFEDLDRCLQLASGRLAYADGRIPQGLDGQTDDRTLLTLVKDLRNRSGDCGHDVCEHAFDDWNACLGSIRERRRPWKLLTTLKGINMAVSLLAAERANLCRGFPRKKMHLQDALKSVVGLDEFWSTEITFQKTGQLQHLAWWTFWNETCIPHGEMISANWVNDFKSLQTTIKNPFTDEARSFRKQYFKDDKTMALMQAVRSFLAKWTADPADESVEEIDSQKMSSQTVAQLLTCLDVWLLTKGGGAASCSMLTLMYRLGRQAQFLTVSRREEDLGNPLMEIISDSNVSWLKDHPNGGGPPRMWREKGFPTEMRSYRLDNFNMSSMLVLRGILMSLLLSDGADTSMLYEPDFRNSVVRML